MSWTKLAGSKVYVYAYLVVMLGEQEDELRCSALCVARNWAELKPTEEQNEETEAQEAEHWEQPNEDMLRGKGDGGNLAQYKVCRHHYTNGQVAEAQSREITQQRLRKHHPT